MSTLTIHDTVGPFKMCSYLDRAWGGRKFCLVDQRTGVTLDGQYTNLPAAQGAADIRCRAEQPAVPLIERSDTACGGFTVRLVEADYRASGGQITYSGVYGPFDTETDARTFAAERQGPIAS